MDKFRTTIIKDSKINSKTINQEFIKATNQDNESCLLQERDDLTGVPQTSTIKQEFIEGINQNNENCLLQEGTMCTTGITNDIKVERDYIGDFEFMGIVATENNSSQSIYSIESDIMLNSSALRLAKASSSTHSRINSKTINQEFIKATNQDNESCLERDDLTGVPQTSTIKQEFIEGINQNNKNCLLQEGTMCTTGITNDIKVERDYIGDFEFVGIVATEKNSSQSINSIESDIMLNSSALRHAKKHNSNRQKSLICDICKKTFYNKTILRKHVIRHITKKQMKRTILCNEASSSTHTHICEVCDRSFRFLCRLKLHMRIHTGERPYKCDICDLRFSHKLSLDRHRIIHTGDAPHKCNICDRTFLCASYLKSHTITHTGERAFRCKICDYGFHSSYKLKVHMRVHTGEKFFKCNMCDKAYYCSSSLKRHKMIHTGDTPHKCNTCDGTFSSAAYLKTHKRTHTG